MSTTSITPDKLIASPYPGLRPFRRDESAIFFGRDQQIVQLLNRLEQNHFLAVVGPSGCGKSSLVLAGLLPALDAGLLASSGARWRVAEMRPRNQPLANLTKAVLDCGILGDQWRPDAQSAAMLAAALRRGPLGLAEVLNETASGDPTNLLLLVDQFEELFRFQESGNQSEAVAFVDLLLSTARERKAHVVITMRTEYLGKCGAFHGLPEAMNDGQFLTPRLRLHQIREAIEQPALAFGAEVEPALINRVLSEMGTDPDQLPLMQHVLKLVWNHARPATVVGASSEAPAADWFMSVADYEQLGCLEGALSKRADEVYAELDESGQRLAEIMFRCLSQREAELGESRRPELAETIAKVAGVSLKRLQDIVDAYRQSDCSFVTPTAGKLESNTKLDITHESLIRKWKRMQTWLEREAEDGANYGRLLELAISWKRKGDDPLGEQSLENFKNWIERARPSPEWAERYGGQFGLTEELLSESAKAVDEKRQRTRRNRVLIFAWAVLATVMAGIAVVTASMARDSAAKAVSEAQRASWQTGIAKKAAEKAALEADRANRQTHIAIAHRLSAEAQEVKHLPHRSLLLAAEAVQSTGQHDVRVPAAEKALREALRRCTGRGLSAHTTRISRPVPSPDGRWLVSIGERASEDGIDTVYLWDLKNRATKKIALQGAAPAVSAAVGASSQWLAILRADGMLQLWNLKAAGLSSECAVSINVSPLDALTRTIAIGGDRWLLVNTGTKATVYDLSLIDSAAPRLPPPRLELNGDPPRVVIDPGGWLVRLHDQELSLHDLDRDPIEPVLRFQSPEFVTDFALSRDRRWLVAVHGQSVSRWDLRSDETVPDAVFEGHEEFIQSFALSNDSRWLVTSTWTTVRSWQLAAKAPSATSVELHGTLNAVHKLAISSDSRSLLVVSESGLAVSQLHSGGLAMSGIANGQDPKGSDEWAQMTLLDGGSSVDTAAFSPDNRWLVASEGGAVRLWKTEEILNFNPLRRDLLAHDGPIRSLEMNDHWLVTGGDDAMVQVHDLSDPAYSRASIVWPDRPEDSEMLPDPDFISSFSTRPSKDSTAAVVSPDGLWEAVGMLAGDIQLRRTAKTGSNVNWQTLSGHESRIEALVFSSDSRWLVTGSVGDFANKNVLFLWNLTASPPVGIPLKGHDQSITAVAISSDDRVVASASEDGTARIWDLTADNPAQTAVVLRGHAGAIRDVAVSPDNKWVVTIGNDNTIRLWPLDPEVLLNEARIAAGRNLYPIEWDRHFPGEKYRKTFAELPQAVDPEQTSYLESSGFLVPNSLGN